MIQKSILGKFVIDSRKLMEKKKKKEKNEKMKKMLRA